MNLQPISDAALKAEVEAEIARVAGRPHRLLLTLDGPQTQALLAMRGAGMQWPAIMAFWKRKGWPGSPNTLRRVYREATGDATEA